MFSLTDESSTGATFRRTARLVFVAFLITFVAALLGLLAFAPRAMRPRHWWTGALVIALAALFFTLLARSLHHAEDRARPRLERLEQQAPQ